MNRNKFFSFFFFSFLFLVFCSYSNTLSVGAFAVGVTPSNIDYNVLEEQIINKKIVLFNPNNYSIEYEMNTCDNDIFDYLPKGLIQSNAYKIVDVMFKKNQLNLTDCFIDILFSKGNYRTAFSIGINFIEGSKNNNSNLKKQNTNPILGRFWNNNTINNNILNNKDKSNYIFVIIASLVFMVLLIAVILHK